MSTLQFATVEKYEILPNKVYVIREKPTEETEDVLRKEGRAKRGAGFIEVAGCPWDGVANTYDHGLDKYSQEFAGKEDKEVTNILKGRKSLIDYLENLTKGDKTKINEVIASKVLVVKHDMVINTGRIDDYFKLYLAMRGTVITPPNQLNNFAKYGSSMFQLVDNKQVQSSKAELTQKKWDILNFFSNKLGTNIEDANAYLRYVGILGYSETKEPHFLLEVLNTVIENDFSKMSEVYKTIKEVDLQEIILTNKLKKLAISRKIVRETDGNYYFQDINLGSDLKSGARSLLKRDDKEARELIIKIQEEK